MHIRGAGENALIVYLGARVGDGPSPGVSARVQAACAACEAALGDGLIDLVPSYASLLVVFDCQRTDHDQVRTALQRCLAHLSQPHLSRSNSDTSNADTSNFGTSNAGTANADISNSDPSNSGLLKPGQTMPDSGKLVRLRAWYGPEAGPDIERVAERAGLSVAEVIDIHQATEYRVYAIGFAPGFAYLGQVDPRIATPRLATPRQRVPRGAVAIAEGQTAVYPAASPGGWNLIGLCPERLFDPAATPPMPVAVGDRVRFEPIDREQYLALGGEIGGGMEGDVA